MATFSKDPVQGLLDYVNDVKPFHTKILDVFVQYAHTENLRPEMTDTLIIDIGLQPQDVMQPIMVESISFVFDTLDLTDEMQVNMDDNPGDVTWSGDPWDTGTWNGTIDPLVEIT